MRMVRLAREILDSIEFDDDRHAIARELAALAIAEHDPELHAIMFANREHDPWGVGGPR
jgi:hypothetical protein